MSEAAGGQCGTALDDWFAAEKQVYGPIQEYTHRVAYALWEAGDRQWGKALDFWLDAERMVVGPVWLSISQVAERLWEEGGRQHGKALDHWLTAQSEVLGAIRGITVPPETRPMTAHLELHHLLKDIGQFDPVKASESLAHRGTGAGGRHGPPHSVECYFLAEMDAEVVVEQTTSVDVTIAREALAPTKGRESDVKKGAVERAKKLIVQIVERRSFRVEGDRRVEIKVPEPGEPAQVMFDVIPLVAGAEGDLWVQVRQGPVPLITLKLRPKIVAQRGASTPERMEAAGEIAAFPPAQKPLDEIRIHESVLGETVVRYHFTLDLHSLGILKHFESQPLPGARDDYIKQLLNEIGDSWAGEGKEGLVAFERGQKAIGGKMFDQLIPREMQQLLSDKRDRIRTVQVFSMEPFIPWELVYLKNPAERVAPKDSKFLGELGLVRWFYEGFPPSSLKIGRERAVYVIPDYPPGLELPEAADEAEMLKPIFKDAKGIPAQLNTIETLLETPGAFDLLHFGGHGEAAGTDSSHARLLIDGQLEDGKFVGEALSATTVEQTAQLKTDVNQPIVVLNACESARRNREFAGMGGFADAFVKAGAGVFVGTHWSVGDAPARTFIEVFYQSFTAPKKKAVWLSDAVTEARQAARNAGDATWLAYVVYGHPRCTVKRTA